MKLLDSFHIGSWRQAASTCCGFFFSIKKVFWHRSAGLEFAQSFLVSDHRCVSRACYSPSISISCVAAFNLDNEQPDYDMDSEDETLLNRLNRKMEIKPLQFEIMVDRLEKASSSQVWYEEITGRFCFPGGWFWLSAWFYFLLTGAVCLCEPAVSQKSHCCLLGQYW